MGQWKIILLLLLVFSALHSVSRGYTYRYDNLYIDCGALDESRVANKDYERWHTDEDFIKTGENKFLSTSSHTLMQMNTLLFFPKKSRKNCYYLPLFAYDQFNFRAGFYYGNYDDLSKPPSFRLEIDGHFWANVTTSMSEEPVLHELIYITKKEHTTVCLIRTTDYEVPFISSLEVNVLDRMYTPLMDNNTALYLHSRINYGANETVEKTMTMYDECCNRIWKPKQMPDYLNISSTKVRSGYSDSENRLPWPVMAYAIQAYNITDSIYISIDFTPQKTTIAYFVLYFMDPVDRITRNQTSEVEIYIDNVKMGVTDVPVFRRYVDQYHVVYLYPNVVFGSANVTISPVEGSTLAPILNAMEVFSAVDVSTSSGNLFKFLKTLIIVCFHIIGLFVIF